MINILIADDEKIISEGLKRIIMRHSERYNVLDLAGDGLAAIEIAKREHPHILITDIRMPNLGGIELLKWMKKNKSKTKTIILSGYDDVEYLHECLRLNVSDYLLKPVNKERLLQLIDTLANEIEQNFREIETDRMLRETHARFSEDFYNRLVAGDESEISITKFLKNNNIEFNDESYKVAVIGITDNNDNDSSDDISLMNYAVKNIVEELLCENRVNCIGFLSKNNRIIFLVESSRIDLPEVFKKIKEIVYSAINYTLAIGISSEVDGIKNTPVAYKEAWSSYCNTLFWGSGIWVYKGTDEEDNSLTLRYADELIKCLENLNSEKYIQIIDNFLRENFIRKNPEYVYEFIDVFFDKIRDAIADKSIIRIGMQFNSEEIQNLDTAQEIRNFLINIMSEMISETKLTIDMSLSRKIFEAKKHIDRNYFENISLNKMAKDLNLSPSYFSELFKKEIGVTFGEYVTRVRIEKAKELLADVDLTINQVSEMVGYDDRSYFSKVFKKKVGKTPQKYRNSVSYLR